MMMKGSFPILVMSVLGTLAASRVDAVERWLLFSRHGECAEVATLKRKVPDLGQINTPQAFVSFMRSKGLSVTSAPMALPGGQAHEVNVPALELSLVFVTSELCARAEVRGKN
jgi:hypothetical protein